MARTLRKRLLLAAYWFVVVAVVGVLLAEIVLRLERRPGEKRWVAEQEAELRRAEEASQDSLWDVPWHRYRPDAEIEIERGGERVHVRINRHGFRTDDFEIEKPEGTVRVLCIGASTTIQGATNDQTYPAVLGRLLRERFPGESIEVLNLGISGTRARFWIDEFDQLISYQPDVVVQYNAINDLAWEHLDEHGTKHRWIRLRNHSDLIERLFPLEPATFDPYFDKLLDLFKQLAGRLRREGVHYVVGSFATPRYSEASPDFQELLDADVHRAWGGGVSLSTYPAFAQIMDRYNDRFATYVEEHSLRAAMVHRSVDDAALFTDSCHMTQAGIEALAGAFLPEVERILKRRLRSAAARRR